LQPLFISGKSIATGAGIGTVALAAALASKRGGLTPCDFEDASLDTWIGRIPAEQLQPVRTDLARFECRNHRIAQLALRQDGFEDAVMSARARYGPGRIGVFLGTSTSGILETEQAYRLRKVDTGALPDDFRYATTQNNFALPWFVQSYFGLDGAALAVSTACSSSAKVFGTAARMVAAGLCDAAIVGGADSLCLTTLYGFQSLGLLSSRPCRPFDANRDGISIGEGAAFVLLERPDSRAIADSVCLLGVGESSDAHHMSAPHPQGLGARMAMQHALEQAQLPSEAIQYINLHGTGTKSNDETEAKAVSEVFGSSVPCSSTKGWTGHTLGACGAIEAVIAALVVESGLLPGSMHTRELDASMGLNYLIDGASRRADIVMSNAFGFGGTNCSLVLGRAQR
jgi:3-oxoacyl-[acyl-carrier-protein] synthase I